MTDAVLADAVTVRRVRRLMCVFTALLVASTWPLWIPGPEFPDIPWLRLFCSIEESWIDWIFPFAAALWLVLEFRGMPREQLRTWLVRAVLWGPIAFALMVDQHRLQPWVWQMLLMALLISFSNDRTALRCLRWFTVSIYFHSAVSKIDVTFLESHGQWLLEGLASSVGLSTAFWSETTRRMLAGLFPVGEMLTALALLWARSRRMGLVMAFAMHGLLLLALGPLGHDQKQAVLVWNAFFIALDVLLFGRWSGHQNEQACTRHGSAADLNSSIQGKDPVGPSKFSNPAATGLTAVFVLLPCLSWWGYWDHWPSWAVYSSRPAIVQMFVSQETIDDLPKTLCPFVGPPQPLSHLCPVNLDAWSFETLWCPVYPQERYRMALAAALGSRHDLDEMRVVLYSSPDRWTEEREKTVFDGIEAVMKRARGSSHYRLNTWVRDREAVIPPIPQN